MEAVRKIRKVWKSRPTVEGAGVHLKRAFGFNQVPQLDPFLLLDAAQELAGTFSGISLTLLLLPPIR